MTTRNQLAAYLGGGGEMIGVTVPNPGANTNFSQLVPVNREWRLHSCHFIFTAAAVAANRTIRLIQSSGLTVFSGQFGLAVTSSQVHSMTCGLGLNDFSANGRQLIGALDARLLAGDTIMSSQVVGFQAGDTFTNIRILVEEWIRS